MMHLSLSNIRGGVQATDSDDELAMRMQKRAKLLAKKVLIKDMDEHHENQRRPLAFIDLTNGSPLCLSLRRTRFNGVVSSAC
jgi:hypothetical protein